MPLGMDVARTMTQMSLCPYQVKVTHDINMIGESEMFFSACRIGLLMALLALLLPLTSGRSEDDCCGGLKKKADDKATTQTKSNDIAKPSDGAKPTVELGNARCPITGEKVGAMQKDAHVDYKGTRVGLCCSGCKSKFLANPDANLKKASKSVSKTPQKH